MKQAASDARQVVEWQTTKDYLLGVPEGMRVILQERGIDTHGMVANDMKSFGESPRLPK